jgi:hypothetical protein
MKKSSVRVYTCDLPPEMQAAWVRVRERMLVERHFAMRLEAQSRWVIGEINLMLYGAGLVR